MDREQLKTFAGILQREHFTEEQARKAEIWLYRGNWSFRGKDAQLEYADFFPTADQCDVGETVVVLMREDYAQRQQRWYQQGYNDRKVEDWQKLTDESARTVMLASAEQLKDMLRAIEELEERCSRQRRELDEYYRGGVMHWRTKFEHEQQERARVELSLVKASEVMDLLRQEAEDTERQAKNVLRRLFEDDSYYRQSKEEYFRHKARMKKTA